jgi:hypothetical protein
MTHPTGAFFRRELLDMARNESKLERIVDIVVLFTGSFAPGLEI